MTNRKAIPDKVQAKIMDKSAARCAICYSTRMNTDVVYPVPGFQSAHIDQNAANCAENNLYRGARFNRVKNHVKAIIHCLN